MSQLIIRLLFISLLFGSMNAAAETVCMDSHDVQDIDYLVFDHNDPLQDIDDQEDCCDHFCKCTSQLGIIFSRTSTINLSCVTSKIADYTHHHSRTLSPLFRPPII